jgi:hypothetical protein
MKSSHPRKESVMQSTTLSSAVFPLCPCGIRKGFDGCRCGQPFSAVEIRAVGAGALCVVAASSRRAPAGMVALGAFPLWSQAASFARACPRMFGVVPPFVRRSVNAWIVSVPVSSRL